MAKTDASVNDARGISVLHIVNKWKKGGVERFVEDFVGSQEGCRLSQSMLSICTGIVSSVDCPKYGPMHDGESMPSMLWGAFALDGFLAGHVFDVVHIHTQNSSGFLYAAIAKKRGVPCRIIHSHNSSLGIGSGVAKRMAQVLFRVVFEGSETTRLACSTEAGEHLFSNNGFRIVPNGIELDRFLYNDSERHCIREHLGISDGEMLVSCVGSMIQAKNHIRALSVFAELLHYRPDAKLLILGDGELRSFIEEESTRLGIADRVCLPGYVEDAWRWYSAMDAVLFPSLHEGFPLSLVEAQCNGLPVVCSDTVTREVGILESCRFLSLEDSDTLWAKVLLSAHRDTTKASAELVKSKGFDRESTAELLLEIYTAFDSGYSGRSACLATRK